MKKSVIIILSTLIVLSTGLGTVGLLANNKGEEKPVDTPKNYEIKYIYYLDEEPVTEMPKNNRPSVDNTENIENDTTEKYEDEYTFKEFRCTNNVTGEWNNETWEFIINETSDSTCALYFESNFLSVNITANNAEVNELDEFKDRKVKRGESITYSITPEEGHEFKEVSCTNNTKAEWDKENKKLTVSEVTKNTECTIDFSIGEYKVTFEATNGNIEGDKEVTSEYGKTVSTKITPKENYVFESYECENKQTAKYNETTNTFTIEKLTNNSNCKIKFKEKEPETYKVTLNVLNGTFETTNTSGEVKPGGKITYSITPKEGYVYENADIDCGEHATNSLNGSIFSVTNVKSDVTCSIVLQAEQSGTETNTTSTTE